MTISKWGLLALALALTFTAACTPDKKAEEELLREVQSLKAEIKALHEKVAKLEASEQEIMKSQETILSLLKAEKPGLPAPPAPETPAALTLSQLLREKERFLGSRITLKAMPGLVVVHRKTMIFKAPEGTLEVYYGGLPDALTVNRLSATTLDQPLTITGFLNPPARMGGALRITAEAIEF